MEDLSDRTPGAAVPRVTELLLAWSSGDTTALDRLLPILEGELHRLARLHMAKERDGHTLQPTALVSEVYLRLATLGRMRWQDRTHFFAMSARLMRRILVDHARARRVGKRGGGLPLLPLDAAPAGDPIDPATRSRPDLEALDDALEGLGRVDARKARVVELRFFAGLSVQETASALCVSPETVIRDWRLARAWLLREIARSRST